MPRKRNDHQPDSLEDETETQRGGGRAEDLEGIDRADADGNQREEEVHEVDEGEHDHQQGDAQQRPGRRLGPLGARHTGIGLEVELRKGRKPDGQLVRGISAVRGRFDVHFAAHPVPEGDELPGIGPGAQLDEIVETPLRRFVETPVAQIVGDLALREQRIVGKILEDGHDLPGVLRRGILGIYPKHVAHADVQRSAVGGRR